MIRYFGEPTCGSDPQLENISDQAGVLMHPHPGISLAFLPFREMNDRSGVGRSSQEEKRPPGLMSQGWWLMKGSVDGMAGYMDRGNKASSQPLRPNYRLAEDGVAETVVIL